MQLAMSFALESLRLGAVPLTGPLSVQPDTTPKAAAREALMPMSGGPEGHDTGKVTYQGASWVQQGGAPHVFGAEQLPPPAVPSLDFSPLLQNPDASQQGVGPARQDVNLLAMAKKLGSYNGADPVARTVGHSLTAPGVFVSLLSKGSMSIIACTGIQIGVSDVHLVMEADHSLTAHCVTAATCLRSYGVARQHWCACGTSRRTLLLCPRATL